MNSTKLLSKRCLLICLVSCSDIPLFDDPPNLSTKAVLDWYDLLTSGLVHEQTNARAILRSGSSPPSYLRDTLIGATPDDVDEYFESCQLELDLCADLLLIAWAEARVRMDAEKRRLHSDVLGKRLSLLYQNKETLWGLALYEGGILEAWKQHINNSAQIPSSDKSLEGVHRIFNRYSTCAILNSGQCPIRKATTLYDSGRI